MTLHRIASLALRCALLPALAFAALAHSAALPLVEAYPAGSIASVSDAEEALARANAAYADIGRQFADEKAACYDRFLVSACLADVRQRQRDARTAVRKVEVEARAFLRKERAAERDRSIAERARRSAGGRGRTIPLSGAARDDADPEPGPDLEPSKAAD